MNFKQLTEEADYETPEELVSLATYSLLTFEGEEVVDSTTAQEYLNLYDFGMSSSAVAIKLKNLEEKEYLQWMERQGAPSGYILTPRGMSNIEGLIPFQNSNSESDSGKKGQDDQQQSKSNKRDVFLSHASEDKDDFVEPLANKLEEMGLDVWYDDFELSIGDSIPAEIDKGLSQSNYGIVVLSEHFFQKDWPHEELYALIQRDVDSPYNLILQVWYNIGKETVKSHNSLLTQRMAIKADSENVNEVAKRLYHTINGTESESPSPKNGNQFDYETLKYIAEITADAWSGDDVKKLFKRIGFDIDWSDGKEGTLREYIATFPVEAHEKGIDVDKARENTILTKLEELNDKDCIYIIEFIERLSHPRTHLNQKKRHQEIVDELNNVLEFEELRVTKDGEVKQLD